MSAAERVARGLQDLRSLLLGFDVDPQRRAPGAVRLPGRARPSSAGRPLDRARSSCCTVFADLSELSRNRPAGEETKADSRGAQPARVLPHATCRASTSSGPGCRRRSSAGSPRCSRHYGVDDLDRTPELEDAVFRIFLAQQRASADVAVVVGAAAAVAGRGRRPPRRLRERAGLALEHLVAATQVRFPVVGDLARGVVFRWFAQPLLRRNRAEVYAGVREHLRYLDREPGRAGPRRADRRHGRQRRAAGPAARPADRPRRRATTRRCWRC